MPNPFHNSDVAQQNKTSPTGGSGKRLPSRGPSTKGSLNMKVRSWPAAPGKSGPKRDTLGVRHPPQHAQDKGL